MVPGFYKGTGTTSLCALARANKTLAAERMRAHLDNFISEADFAWLAANGFNAVRIPIGYWNVLGPDALPGAQAIFVPEDSAESFAVLDRWFRWSRAHGISILLDLHGAPRSQNGADHVSS